MLPRSLVLVLFLQWLATTSAVEKNDASPARQSQEELQALEWTTPTQRKAWQNPMPGPEKLPNEAQEQVWRVEEISGNPFVKLDPDFQPLGIISPAVIEDIRHYFEKNIPHGVNGRKTSQIKFELESTEEPESSMKNVEVKERISPAMTEDIRRYFKKHKPHSANERKRSDIEAALGLTEEQSLIKNMDGSGRIPMALGTDVEQMQQVEQIVAEQAMGQNPLKIKGELEQTERSSIENVEVKGRISMETEGRQVEKTVPDVASGQKSVKLKGNHELTEQQQSSTKYVDATERIRKHGQQGKNTARNTAPNTAPGDVAGTKPAKNKSDDGLTEQHRSLKEDIFTTLPEDWRHRIGKRLLDEPVGDAIESVTDYLGLKAQKSLRKDSVDLKGVTGDRFRMKEKVQERGKMQGEVDEAEKKEGKVFLGESGKMGERVREWEKIGDGMRERGREGERRIVGRQGEMKERMKEWEKMVSGRIAGEDEGERMLTGCTGDTKEKMKEWERGLGERMKWGKEGKKVVGERTGGGKEGKQMIDGHVVTKERTGERDKAVGDRMERGRQGEQMIAGRQNEMKGKMSNRKEREREGKTMVTMKNRKIKERKHETVVGDKNHVVMHFEHKKEGWLPGWIIEGRSRDRGKERKIEIVDHVEMQKERDLKGHKMEST